MGFYIGKVFIPYYGFYIVCGLVAASAIGVFQVKRFHKKLDDFILLAAIVSLGSIIGAKALYLIVSWKTIDFSRITDFNYFNELMGGGFVFYGGLFGGFACLLFCKKWFLPDTFTYTEICIPCIPVVHGFGRLGCSAVGCCYGIPTYGDFSIIYQNSSFACMMYL